MSLIPFIFGGKSYEQPHHQTWNANQNHGMGNFGTNNHTHHMMPFPIEPPRPIMKTQVEWKETPEAHVYKAHLPGLKSSDVRVEVDDERVLCIICEKKAEKEENRGGWRRVELSSGHFVQRLTLPENSKVDHVKAYMDNGVLTITVPKHTVHHVKHHPYPVRNINISHEY